MRGASRWATGRRDLKGLVGPSTRVPWRGRAFNAARTAELLRRRFAPWQRFDAWSELRLDVVIPVSGSDALVLPLVIDALRRNLRHPIGKVIVVTAGGSEAADIAAAHGAAVVDEDAVLPLRRSDLAFYRVEPWDRSGWLFAQLLKLDADDLST